MEDLFALMEQPNQVMLIAIVGFGGSGNTTLARAVYNSVADGAFSLCAWISIDLLEKSDHLGILTDIQLQLLPRVPFSLPALKDYLKLKEKRWASYLLE